MKLGTYLAELTPEKRAVLLGRETADPLHQAFASKRVVHAGLIGAPLEQGRQQDAYQAALGKQADMSRQHALYIHIPFCQTKCLYCGFYQNASRQEVEDVYIQHLLAEIRAEAQTTQLQGTPIDAVFIGGGTPTSLSPANVAALLQTLQQSFCLTQFCEVTLEGRIHDLVPEKIETWLQYGVNRISLGVQSFDTALRQRIGRIDTREEVLRRLRLLKSYDVTVIVDLIYGLPGQTLAMWLEDVKTLAEADVDGMDLYQLNIFPGGPLAKAVENGVVPPCTDIAGQADMYIAARDYLLAEGVERLSLCHWRRTKRERSLYNTLAKAGADVYAFGCGAGGHFGGISFMNQRALPAYQADRTEGKKPIMMAGHQVEAKLGRICDDIIRDLEKGFVDFRRLLIADNRLEDLETVLTLWQERGLLQEDLGVYRLTKAGEFWYISLTQSLVECVQVLWEEQAEAPAEEINGKAGEALDEVLAEMLPDSTAEKRRQMVSKIPAAVRMMLRHSSKETLQSMLAGMPPAMREKMLQRTGN
ncbi:heme anaerobic degradation radical SAM methyltransferase ChuW/HutW [Selenomonas ruminantium]|uniref:Oxygen-independent coproporphyrinogen-3 oxidase n=1 Tax=Selenomonas ruminantium TaxID=971 RepID=A0A1H0UJX9_SELRU|nr:heme anaerobic degradation radical SAM methyltransferase ChuW/HutW [Selenomonas ruminantium]SDP66499.1 oxygen-independent coproporphyrinogen-3 oxidase [Selenomonas ruminantium]